MKKNLTERELTKPELEKREDAILCINELINLDKSYHDAYVQKGIFLFELKKYEDAIACTDKAGQIDPIRSEDQYFNKSRALHELEN